MLGLLIAGTVIMLIWVYRLTSSMGSKAAWAWVVVMFFPCLNLLFLLMINNNATAWCRRHGIKVGLLGPPKSALEDLS